jgi:hypothetical protein
MIASRTASKRRTARTAFVLFGAVAALGNSTAAFAQQIRGRVVDEQSRSAIVEASVTLYAAADTAPVGRAGTADDGFFSLKAPGPGEYRVVVERIGYAPAERQVTLDTRQELVVPAFVLQSRAVPLDPVDVVSEARAIPDSATYAVGFRRPSHLVAGERLAELEQVGASMDAAVRQLGAGLRVRHLLFRDMVRGKTCVEITRRLPSFRLGARSGGADTCDMVAIVLDGVTIPDPLAFFQHQSLRDYESIEYVPAPEAGTLFGMEASAKGALVLWTRGRGPHRSPQRSGGGHTSIIDAA